MFSTLVTVALFVAPAIQGVLADFAINTPALKQCQTSRISWEPTKGPYNLIVVKASEPCGDALVEVGDFTKTFIDWKTTIPAGTEVQLSLVDADDDEAWSGKGAASASASASSSAPAASATAGSTSTSTTTSGSTSGSTSDDDSSSGDLTPVGAANAGTNPFGTSGAITARQASTPLLVLAGLVAAFMSL
ncbi:hypothetical protein NLJ89_g9820 [Agrocybe chaxingu]|uniref:Uncharacterized protein n=1 Tax=Agrocybe chaxingu TaxID=84603 RepID=A0A9W8MQV2_9AGAR|nr:hypothetical protein NLJ89_g9820 [Agrocybe chaxingu]